MTASAGRVNQIRVQNTAEQLLRMLEANPEITASISAQLERRAIAYIVRYHDIEVIDFRAEYVRLRKKEAGQ